MSDKPAQKKTVNKRGAARLAAVQALFQMELSGQGVLETAAEYETFRLGKELDGEQLAPADASWFRSLLGGVVEHQTRLDPIIRNSLADGWTLSRLDGTLRAVLRGGAFELLHREDVPTPVIISEYVDIASAFYIDGDETKIVNAVLDRIAREHRAR
ncbi:MAG: transcription antitermination factor NusB [Pseudomonadota bacterium]